MRKFVVVGSVALALGVSALGPAAHAEMDDSRIGELRDNLLPDQTTETGPVPQASVLSPYEATDPEDAPGRADILDYRARHTDRIALDLELRNPVDPVTNDHWLRGYSAVIWDISTDGDETSEFFVIGGNNGTGKLVAKVFKFKPNYPVACRAQFTRPSTETYRLRFKRSCIKDPTTIRVIATMFFDNKPYSTEERPSGPEDFGDNAPDQEFPVVHFTPEIAFG
jgi:hypothetical protein